MPTNRMERLHGLLIYPCNGTRSCSPASHFNRLVLELNLAISTQTWDCSRGEGRKRPTELDRFLPPGTLAIKIQALFLSRRRVSRGCPSFRPSVLLSV